jgi:hypothetical protein
MLWQAIFVGLVDGAIQNALANALFSEELLFNTGCFS